MAERQTYPSDYPAAVHECYVKYAKSDSRKIVGTIRYYCESEAEKLKMTEKISQVKYLTNATQPNTISNKQLLTILLDSYLNQKQVADRGNISDEVQNQFLEPSTFIGKESYDEPIFLSSSGAVTHLARILSKHKNSNASPNITCMSCKQRN